MKERVASVRSPFSSTWQVTSPTWATPGQSRSAFSAVVARHVRRSRRPCPLSRVVAVSIALRQICCCRGGKSPSRGRGECGWDVGQKRRLIFLDEPQVMPLRVENLLAQVALAATMLKELAEIAISGPHIRLITEQVDGELLQDRDAQASRFATRTLPPQVANVPAVAVVEVDGGRLQIRASDGGRGVSLWRSGARTYPTPSNACRRVSGSRARGWRSSTLGRSPSVASTVG
jgi:hypothetical protein